jgi:transposase
LHSRREENPVGIKVDRWATKALELRTYIAELRVIEQQRQMIVKRIEHKLEASPEYALIHTIPGIGLETGSALLAEIGIRDSLRRLTAQDT